MPDSQLIKKGLVWCYVKDFQNNRKLALETVCFLCDYRDAEELTLTLQKVPELRNDAKAIGVKIAHHMKKLDLLHKMVAFKCALFWPYVAAMFGYPRPSLVLLPLFNDGGRCD